MRKTRATRLAALSVLALTFLALVTPAEAGLIFNRGGRTVTKTRTVTRSRPARVAAVSGAAIVNHQAFVAPAAAAVSVNHYGAVAPAALTVHQVVAPARLALQATNTYNVVPNVGAANLAFAPSVSYAHSVAAAPVLAAVPQAQVYAPAALVAPPALAATTTSQSTTTCTTTTTAPQALQVNPGYAVPQPNPQALQSRPLLNNCP